MRRFGTLCGILIGCVVSLIVGAAALFVVHANVFFPSETSIKRSLDRYSQESDYGRRVEIIARLVTRMRAPDTDDQSNTMAHTFRMLEDLYRSTHDEALLEGLERPKLMGDTAMQRCFLYERLSSDGVFQQITRKRSRTQELVEICKKVLGPRSFQGAQN